MTAFRAGLKESAEIKALSDEVLAWASQFDIPGFDATNIEA